VIEEMTLVDTVVLDRHDGGDHRVTPEDVG
jgi:hypothetical protein